MFDIPVLAIRLLVVSWITAKRQLIHDRTASRTSWEQNYDFIVVGAGTAGCAVAYRLTENPNVKVLLLETGGAQSALWSDMPGLVYNITERDPEIQYMYYSVPQINVGKQYPGRRAMQPLGRVLGGSSSHNTLIYNRGNRRTYDEWAHKYGAEGWTWNEVLPFFRKFENNTDRRYVENNPGNYGTNGPVQISSVKRLPQILRQLISTFNELGYQTTDYNGANQTGVTVPQQFIDSNGVRSSSANAYIDPNRHPNNLHIVTNAQVVEILFDGLTAVGVEFTKSNQGHRVYAQKEIILTAGVTNTPKLLMLSGIGINSHLQSFGIPVRLDLPVGNNYMNHPQINVYAKIENPEYFYPNAELNIGSLQELYFNRTGRLSESPFIGVYYSTKNNTPTDCPNQLLYIHVANDTLVLTLNHVKVHSRGTVRLESTNPYVQPRLDPAYLADRLDFEDVVESIGFVFYVLEKSSIAPYVRPSSFESIGCPVCPNKYQYECTEGIRCWVSYNTQTTYHPCCSTRMGAVHRSDVVVDPRLRVKNVKQLRICDASIFPSIPNSNTNAPTHMVAEKCAHLIKEDYNLGP